MTLATRADQLALELVESAHRPDRVLLVASELAALAAQLHQQEAAALPPHLRQPPRALPPGVVKLCGRRLGR